MTFNETFTAYILNQKVIALGFQKQTKYFCPMAITHIQVATLQNMNTG